MNTIIEIWLSNGDIVKLAYDGVTSIITEGGNGTPVSWVVFHVDGTSVRHFNIEREVTKSV